jgi:RHS repeat-associated protein
LGTGDYNYDSRSMLMTTAAICATREVSWWPSYYRGEQYDPDLGLYYLRARYYNPATGRFMSRDPYEPKLQGPGGIPIDPRELHKYLYTGGDPVNFIDPRGREMVEVAEEEEEETAAVEPEVRKAGWELALCYAGIGLTLHAITEDSPYWAAFEGLVAWGACAEIPCFSPGPPMPRPVPPMPWPEPGPLPPGLPPNWCGLECWTPPPGTPIN